MYLYRILDLKIKIIKDHQCRMGQLIKNEDFWKIGNNQDKIRNFFALLKEQRR
jgi:hypothetical protein